MKTFFDPRQRAHDPQFFMANGVRQPSPEQPARVDALLAGLQSLKLAPEAPPDRGLGPIAAVHGAEYLTFLKTIHDRWQRIPGAGPEVVPNIHPDRREAGYPRSAVGQAGYHQADTACPIGPATWDAAYLSAQCA
ncbi:MAG: histone deacetylase family protein, partial [Pseudomonadota bacterium]